MQKKLGFILLVMLLSIALAACGTESSSTNTSSDEAPSEESTNGATNESESTDETSEESTEVTIQHELGEAVVQKNPKNVVVFDFGALDTLERLGIEVAGVAKGSKLPSYLSKYEGEEYENIGSLKEPDFEKIHSMAPGVILISGRQSEAYEELNKIAPTVFVGVDTANYMESFEENVNNIAKIFGKEAKAEAELTKVKETIASVEEITSASEDKALVILTTGGKISAYGAGSRFGLLHDVLGVKAADENIEASTHGMSVTFEYIKETNPDYLYVIDRDKVVNNEAAAAALLDNELVNETNAAKNDNIVYLDPGVWYTSGGGLVSVEMMVNEIEESIQ